MTLEPKMYTAGQSVRLLKTVCDSGTDYDYPSGSVGSFVCVVEDSGNCLVSLDKSQGDTLDSGEDSVMCALVDVEAI